MQLREVPITAVPEGSDELDDEAEWIYKQAFCKPTTSKQVSGVQCKILYFQLLHSREYKIVRYQAATGNISSKSITLFRRSGVQPQMREDGRKKILRQSAKSRRPWISCETTSLKSLLLPSIVRNTSCLSSTLTIFGASTNLTPRYNHSGSECLTQGRWREWMVIQAL